MKPAPAIPADAEKLAALAVAAMAIVVKVQMHVSTFYPFFGALLMRLKLRVDHRHPTMYTDAIVLGFRPTFILGQTWEHLVYFVIHEVMHCALGHCFRRGNRDPKLWNEACDHVVNLLINRDPELAKYCAPGLLCDPRFIGMAAEEVYAILYQEAQQQPQQGQQEQQDDQELSGASGGPGDCCDAGASGEKPNDDSEPEEEESDEQQQGDGEEEGEGDDDPDAGEPGEEGDEPSTGEPTEGDEQAEGQQGEAAPKQQGGLDPADLEELARGWQEAIMTATLAAGGDVDDCVARALGEAQECNKSFQEYIDQFAQQMVQMESTWNRPARRFVEYLPAQGVPGVKGMLVGTDTSASVDDDQLALMSAAAQRLMDEYNLAWVEIVYVDTQVRAIDRFVAGQQISMENAKGGGGTWFDPVFRHALELERQGEEIAGVIYLTDLDGSLTDSMAQEAAHLPTLWVKTNPGGGRVPPGGLGTVCYIYD